ncbi:hypothetical protein HK103_007657 [Boothiomyces macroporosus]|uniref:Uncharacterized protein n=1 Tax=Boothiomyces macroporosus TaxID=261099 RepID=A0AAD5UF20_9FUNG|nr:hypothetical protein HK103_007657 [Boothiomyces macroporosus]
MDEILNKLNQLTEEEKNQLSDKQKKALKALIGSKPSVPFSSATLDHCIRKDGLNLNIDYVSIDAPSLHIPAAVPTPVASDFLCETLHRIKSVWVLDNEKACRIFIDAILTEVLLRTGFGYTGDVDYMFGSSKTKSVDNMDSFLLVVEAKKGWPDSAVPQVLCEAGCLLRKRLAAGKNTPVFAVLTNGLLFRFFAIDIDGVVYASDIETQSRKGWYIQFKLFFV